MQDARHSCPGEPPWPYINASALCPLQSMLSCCPKHPHLPHLQIIFALQTVNWLDASGAAAIVEVLLLLALLVFVGSRVCGCGAGGQLLWICQGALGTQDTEGTKGAALGCLLQVQMRRCGPPHSPYPPGSSCAPAYHQAPATHDLTPSQVGALESNALNALTAVFAVATTIVAIVVVAAQPRILALDPNSSDTAVGTEQWLVQLSLQDALVTVGQGGPWR